MVGLPAPATPNVTDGFESGVLGTDWEVYNAGSGRTLVTSADSPDSGSYQLLMDSNMLPLSGYYVEPLLNEAILHVNAASMSNVTLTFNEKEFSDPDDPMPATFSGHGSYDGVALSVNGVNWYRIESLTGSASGSAYQTDGPFNLSALATSNGLVLGADTQIKFQHYDSTSYKTPTQAFAFDNIQVAGTIVATTTVGLDAPGGNLVVTDTAAGGKNDDLTLKVSGANLLISDPNNYLGAGLGATQVDSHTVSIPLASIGGSIKVNTDGGNDLLTVDYSGGPITKPIAYDGGTGTSNQLIVGGYTGVAVTAVYTGTHQGTIQVGAGGLISYTNLTPLTLGGTATNLIIDLSQTGVQNPDAVVGDDGGAGDPDGFQDPGFSAIYGSTFEYTEFANPTGSLTINLSNNGDTLALAPMDAAFAPGGATPFLVNGGTGADKVLVGATKVATTLNLGAGNDDVNNFGYYDMTGLQSPLNIDGGTGNNNVAFSDALSGTAVTATLSSTQLSSSGWANINYTNVQNFYFEGSSSDDFINILSTKLGTSYIVNGDGGNDTFTIGNTTAAFNTPAYTGTLANIKGPVTILPDYNNTAGTDTLNVDASNDANLAAAASITNVGAVTTNPLLNASGETLTAPTTRLLGFAAANIYYAHGDITSSFGPVHSNRLEFLNVRGSKGNDTITVNDTTATVQTTIDTREGGDAVTINANNLSAANLVQGSDGNDTFTVTGALASGAR